MDSLPPWRDPPIQEAVFELFFPSVSDYSLFVGNIFSNLQNKYPVSAALPANEFPITPSLPGLLRHRFSNSSGALLFQIGQDILTVNCLAYTTFDDYLSHILNVVTVTAENGAPFGLGRLNRLGIRYINRFENISNPLDALIVELPFSSSNADKLSNLKVHDTRQLGGQDENHCLARSFDFAADEQLLLLDLHVYQDYFTPVDLTTDLIVQWAQNAHDVISGNFESLVQDSVKAQRK